MEAKPDPDIATTAVAMPIGGQVKDSSLRSLPMEIEPGRRLPPLPFLFWYLELLVEVSCKPEVHFA